MDYGVGEASLYPVRGPIFPQDVIISSKQPQRFQIFSSFVTGSTWSLFVGPLHGGPITFVDPAIRRQRTRFGLERSGSAWWTQGLCKRRGTELRKDENNHGVHAARTQPESPERTSCTLHFIHQHLSEVFVCSIRDELQRNASGKTPIFA